VLRIAPRRAASERQSAVCVRQEIRPAGNSVLEASRRAIKGKESVTKK